MKNIIVILLVMLVFSSSVINSVYAGQIKIQEISQAESSEMEKMEANSAFLMKSVKGGGDDGLAMIGAVVLVIAVLAALAE